MRISWELGFW